MCGQLEAREKKKATAGQKSTPSPTSSPTPSPTSSKPTKRKRGRKPSRRTKKKHPRTRQQPTQGASGSPQPTKRKRVSLVERLAAARAGTMLLRDKEDILDNKPRTGTDSRRRSPKKIKLVRRRRKPASTASPRNDPVMSKVDDDATPPRRKSARRSPSRPLEDATDNDCTPLDLTGDDDAYDPGEQRADDVVRSQKLDAVAAAPSKGYYRLVHWWTPCGRVRAYRSE